MRELHFPIPFQGCFWVEPGRFLGGRYPGGYDPEITARNLEGLIACGIRRVISLLEEEEVKLLGAYEGALARLAGLAGVEMRCLRMPIRDFDIPSPRTMKRILNAVDEALASARPVFVHCWGGRGRTGTVAGCYLVRHGVDGDEALARIGSLNPNGPSPETVEQREMVRRWVEGE